MLCAFWNNVVSSLHKKLSAWSYCNSRVINDRDNDYVWKISNWNNPIQENTMKVVVLPLTDFVYCAFFLELIHYWEFNTCSDDNLIIFMSWFTNFLPTNQNWVANRFYYKYRLITMDCKEVIEISFKSINVKTSIWMKLSVNLQSGKFNL